jgi:ABC-type uncharacterized transport system involved in gliding motility auxiliary subunit
MLKRILGIVGWIGTILILVGFAIWLLHAPWQQYVRPMALAGLVCLVVYVLGDWREIARMFARRQARYGTLAATSIAIVLGILVGINYIASRENKRWDLTASGEFTLSEQTRKIMNRLDAPLRMTVFDRSTQFDRFKQRLPEYEYASKRVSVEYVDPDKDPGLAQKYEIRSYGTILLQYKSRVERVTSDGEQDITNGIIKVITGTQKKVYFTQGHGEKDTTSAERTGYNGIVTALGHDNYSMDKLVLAQQTDVPADASVVVCAGPTVDLLPQETDMLRRYLQKGGKLLVLVDPPAGAAPPLTNLAVLLRDWDIELGNNEIVANRVVLDAQASQLRQVSSTVVYVAPPYPAHPITDGFGLQTAFPGARSVNAISGGIMGHNAQPFAETDANAWALADLDKRSAQGKISPDEAKGDKHGPLTIAQAVSAAAPEAPAPPAAAPGDAPPKPETRVAVVGDSDFVANFAAGTGGNQDLFLNVVNWLAQQENLIAIGPKNPDDRRLTIPPDSLWWINILALFLIPGAIVGTGVYSWWRRR